MNDMNRFDLVNEGKFTIPLYHGTSTIFLDSIKKNGLGGINPIKEFKIIEALRLLLNFADKYFFASPDWPYEKIEYNAMLNQEVGHMNFRHGSSYLTPARHTAEHYATGQQFGSEIISKTIFLMEKLEKAGYHPDQEAYHVLKAIFDIRRMISKPIVLELTDVALEHVRSETGGYPSGNVNFIREMVHQALQEWESKKNTIRKAREGDIESIKDIIFTGAECKKAEQVDARQVISDKIEIICQQSNFELIHAVPFSQIKIHHFS